jgi:hypothetical protein
VDPQTGKFITPPLEVETILIDGVEVPKPIIDLNADLIFQLTGRQLEGRFDALVGYRHIHGQIDDPSLCIEAREQGGRVFIDCLGFGGAGVALSWGTAVRAMQLVSHSAGAGPFDHGDLVAKLAQPARPGSSP